MGFDLWGAPGKTDAEQVRAFRDAVARAGGKGLLMSNWIPCRKSNRAALLKPIRDFDAIYRGRE